MSEADERIEKAKELESFKDDIQQIEQHEREIIHGKTKEQMIKKTIPARFGKEECVVISSDDFNSLRRNKQFIANRHPDRFGTKIKSHDPHYALPPIPICC